jgi:hypothetical protein
MKAALYARVSTRDQGQITENQLARRYDVVLPWSPDRFSREVVLETHNHQATPGAVRPRLPKLAHARIIPISFGPLTGMTFQP